jgi:hypothetical protein
MLTGFSHQGWEWHPWDAERQYLAPLEASGLIERVNDTGFQESVSGAKG